MQGLKDAGLLGLMRGKIFFSKFSVVKVLSAWMLWVVCGSECTGWSLPHATCTASAYVLSTNAHEVKNKMILSCVPFVLLQSLLYLSLHQTALLFALPYNFPCCLYFFFPSGVSPSLLTGSSPFTSGAGFRTALPGSLLTSV